MNNSGNSPVKPVVGFALTYGKSYLGWKTMMDDRDFSRYSTRTLGTMLEFGLLVKALSPLQFSLLAQFHRFEPNFGNDHRLESIDRYVVILPSVQLGAQYVFPKIKIG